jgi:hypothetical protein
MISEKYICPVARLCYGSRSSETTVEIPEAQFLVPDWGYSGLWNRAVVPAS